MDRYVCIDSFILPFEDEDGGITEEYGTIKKGSIWEVSNENGESEVRLYLVDDNSNATDFSWIDITHETLYHKFIKKLN